MIRNRRAAAFAARLDGLFTDEPIAFRTQNGGDYDARQVLKPDLGHGAAGTRIHVVQPDEARRKRS